MAESEWLASLSVGDAVIVHGRSMRISKVEHATAMYVTVNGTRYRRKDGFAVGDHSIWNHPMCIQPTPERLAQIELHELRNKLDDEIGRLNVYSMGRESVVRLLDALRAEQDSV